ncbi:carboxylesterase/lipase family protein [Streptomyces sp. LE64]|uniref:carboxylesterase/lipase family protein n=1 Tax=Streptomyces sp. LE64 TaxID=3448653 RepID=UPI004042A760
MPAVSDPQVSTVHGTVRGRRATVAGRPIAVFKGVPYAAPPQGPHRFRPPRPPERWDGVRDAADFGPTPPKPPYSEPFARILADPALPGDDWLTVNVWTPDPALAARLPVAVWVHGGSLTRGSSALPVYDGRAFARDGVVLVSFNYRLGVEGYGLFPDAPPNAGLRDQLAALEWVRDNIAAFGGDPDRVTVFGESAGAISIGVLLASPRARGLFHRAVLQSGPPQTVERDRARRMVRRMAARMKVPATAEAFARVDPAALLAAQREAGRRSSPLLGGAAFGVVVDGDLVPEDPMTALTRGDGAAGIDLLMGWTAQEHLLWLGPSGLAEQFDRLGPLALAWAKARCRGGPGVVRGYRSLLPGAGAAEVVGQVVTDHLLRRPVHRLAEVRRLAAPGARTHLYEFAWPSGVPGLGACHALELGFVFDTVDVPEAAQLTGAGAPRWLAREMHGAWVRFITHGDPGWPAWDARHPVRRFGPEPGGTVLHGPRDRAFALWEQEPGPGEPALAPTATG